MRFLATLIGSIIIGFLSLVSSVSFLNFISIIRSGSIGPGGGFSVGIFGVFTSVILTFWLLVVTIMMWEKIRRTQNLNWPIGRGHMIAVFAWASSVAALAFKIYKH
jgi:hypothetical protein